MCHRTDILLIIEALLANKERSAGSAGETALSGQEEEGEGELWDVEKESAFQWVVDRYYGMLILWAAGFYRAAIPPGKVVVLTDLFFTYLRKEVMYGRVDLQDVTFARLRKLLQQ
ncbi:MAG: hypothetical protein J5I94_25770, partial [Phaeodactylibacter sp.]|nr:hypothetical protein [Phaeodactylibacter sp.]